MNGIYRMRDFREMKSFLGYVDKFGASEYLMAIEGDRVVVVYVKNSSEVKYECSYRKVGALHEIKYKMKRRMFRLDGTKVFFEDVKKNETQVGRYADGSKISRNVSDLQEYINILRQEQESQSDYFE